MGKSNVEIKFSSDEKNTGDKTALDWCKKCCMGMAFGYDERCENCQFDNNQRPTNFLEKTMANINCYTPSFKNVKNAALYFRLKNMGYK